MAPDQLDRYRQAVDDDGVGRGAAGGHRQGSQGPDHGRRVGEPQDRAQGVPEGPPADRAAAPQGADRLAELAGRPPGWVPPAAKKRVVDVLRASRPLQDWLDAEVGPSTAEPSATRPVAIARPTPRSDGWSRVKLNSPYTAVQRDGNEQGRPWTEAAEDAAEGLAPWSAPADRTPTQCPRTGCPTSRSSSAARARGRRRPVEIEAAAEIEVAGAQPLTRRPALALTAEGPRRADLVAWASAHRDALSPACGCSPRPASAPC